MNALRMMPTTLLMLGWVVAWASVETMRSAEPNLLELPWVQIMVGVAISIWGGATATLGRYLAARYEARPFEWRIETMRDVWVSITVGAGGYLAGAWYGLSPMALGLVLLLAGYLGVRVLSAVADRLLEIIAKR